MPAALLMSSLHAAVKPLMWQRLAPAELCHRLNRILCDFTPVGKFCSFFYGVLDSAHNRVTYCNAGHNPPLLVGSEGKAAELTIGGAVLGQFPHWIYEQGEIQMSPGDRLMLFTDGLVEAAGSDEAQFGEEKVREVARENEQASADELMQSLLGAASHHCGGHFQDDASLIVLKARRLAMSI
ncbi:MAG TPA: PP2C family protein-serine/threonine phosphatase, partial [Candidatus Sulfotelmatobacter sp.]|nr:PP2C family protein-serine/threonine phosphatase [Candidatus Sulfotelmatobacter sp.]